MHTLKIAACLAAALLAQLLLAKYFAFSRYLDLPLVLAVYFGLQRAPLLGMLAGLLAGLGDDIISGGILGIGGFSKTLLGYLVAIGSIKFSLENKLIRLFVVTIASAINTLLFVGLNFMLGQSPPYIESLSRFVSALGWKALADTVAAAAIYLLMDRIFAQKEPKRFYE